MSRVVIFANGELPDVAKARTLLRPGDILLAADGGARHVLALDRVPHIILGDLDSFSPQDHPMLLRDVQVIRFPTDKNETDLELAIAHAITLKPAEILILAALGGRLDQALANLSLLCQPLPCPISLDDGVEEVFFCHGHSQIVGAPGDLVSLLPWQGRVTGVQTTGLKWALHSETLLPHKTRGISNEMLGQAAAVSLSAGVLLVIHRRCHS